MKYLASAILIAVFVPALMAQSVITQEKLQILSPNRPVQFSLGRGEEKFFNLELKADQIVNINWLANDELILRSGVFDPAGQLVDADDDDLLFIAQKDGRHVIAFKYDESSELSDEQSVTVECTFGFKLPTRAKLKGQRRINGYDIKIYRTPETESASSESFVIFEKSGVKKRILRDYGSDYIGHSFSDELELPASTVAKQRAALIKNTIDKTGDGVPDVMIDYFSGGAHCCFTTSFFNLGESVELATQIDTQHAGITAIGINPAGGLRFETNENNFAYWNMSFAGSPMPRVVLEFSSGKLHPNFDLMKKAPPSLAVLKSRARTARTKIDLEPYVDDGSQFEEAFWSEMLDLIYTGNEGLAWQYFDLVWPAQKQGKQLFKQNFLEVLNDSYYGSRDINNQNGFGNYWKGFNKIYEQVK